MKTLQTYVAILLLFLVTMACMLLLSLGMGKWIAYVIGVNNIGNPVVYIALIPKVRLEARKCLNKLCAVCN